MLRVFFLLVSVFHAGLPEGFILYFQKPAFLPSLPTGHSWNPYNCRCAQRAVGPVTAPLTRLLLLALLWAFSLMTYLSYIIVYAGVLYSAVPLTSVLNFVCSSSQPSLVPLTRGCTTSASPVLCPFWVLLSIYMLFMSLKCLKVPVLFLFSVTSLPLTSCCSFFHDNLPPHPHLVFPIPPAIWPCLAVVSHALFQAFTWLQLLLCADDSEVRSAPLTVCHRPSSRLPPRLFSSVSPSGVIQAPNPGWRFLSSLYLFVF